MPPPDNGLVYHFNDGKGAVFYCSPGYKLVGSPFLECKGGDWKPKTPPVCVP